MKTAEEWVEIWKADGDGEDTSDHEIGYQLRFAKQIQADALRHAAEICHVGGKYHEYRTIRWVQRNL